MADRKYPEVAPRPFGAAPLGSGAVGDPGARNWGGHMLQRGRPGARSAFWRTGAVAAATALLMIATGQQAFGGPPAPGGGGQRPVVDKQVRDAVGTGGSAKFLVFMREQADL